jgi:hypothetical protein
MERGLLWLPLLVFLVGLTWAGWHEYRKVESYRLWAKTFERAKYDIYAVAGQVGDRLVWGYPSRQGPIDLQEMRVSQIQTVQLQVQDQCCELDAIPPEYLTKAPRKVGIRLAYKESCDRQSLPVGEQAIQQAIIPFTQLDLALEWGRYLQQLRSQFREQLPQS